MRNTYFKTSWGNNYSDMQVKETNGIKETAFMKIKDVFEKLLVSNSITEELRIQYNQVLIGSMIFS